MAVTMQQVRAVLDPEEPDYVQAAQLGADALPHLESLVKGAELMLASKAAYLASLIQDSQSARVLIEAAQSSFPEVRVAAAAGAGNLASSASSDVLLALLDDQDVGVRKVALKSVNSLPADILQASPTLRTVIETLSNTDPVPTIRQLSGEVLRRITPPP